MIQTPRLHLIPVERRHIDAFQEGRNALAELLGVTLPPEWPHFPHALATPADDAPAFQPAPLHWYGYFFIDHSVQALVGNGGFKGPPNHEGVVEIGYEIAPMYQNVGFASEAAVGMLRYAFAVPDVQAVCAHTLGELNASNRVLNRSGFERVPDVEHPRFGTLWAWQITRGQFMERPYPDI